MASYHCTVKACAKSSGGSGAAHADYILREHKAEHKRTDLEAHASLNLPAWAQGQSTSFWRVADQHERANGAIYREIEVALPRELTPEQRRDLVEDFITQQIGDQHPCTWAIHNPKAALEGGEQPHAHIMYSERTLDGIERGAEPFFKRYNAKQPDKGGCRKDSAGTAERLQATRELWARVQNTHLARHGHMTRVDHRTLAEQGIDRIPEQHLGPAAIGYEQRTGNPSFLRRQHEAEASARLEAAKRQGDALRQVQRNIQRLSAEIESLQTLEAAELKAMQTGMADFRAQYQAHKLVEAGKQQARDTFEASKAEQAAQSPQREAVPAQGTAPSRQGDELSREEGPSLGM